MQRADGGACFLQEPVSKEAMGHFLSITDITNFPKPIRPDAVVIIILSQLI